MIRESTKDDIQYVTLNMRQIDWREISPLLFVPNKYILAEQTWDKCKDLAWTAFDKDDEPVAVFGGHIVSPKVAAIWLWATNKINKRVWLEITKNGKHFLDKIFESGEVHRAQATVAEFNKTARKWIKSCGMVHESLMPSYGRGRENYIVMARFS